MRLYIAIFFTILMFGCVSTNVVDDSHNSSENSNTEKSNTQPSTNSNSANNNKNSNVDLSSNTNNTSNTNTDSSNSSGNNSVTSYQSATPSINEESLASQYNMSQILRADGDDSDWKKFREAYILQYLREPKYLSAAFEKNVPKEVIDYLKKGYGMYWSPVRGIEKELEYGFLAARNNNSAGIDSHLEALAVHGKSSGYYTLVYIATMYHVKNNNLAGAQSMANDNDLFQNIQNFAIDIPQADLQNLQTRLK